MIELSDQHVLLAGVLEAVAEAVCLVDRDLRVVAANGAWRAVMRSGDGPLAGQDVLDGLADDDQRAGWRQAMGAVLAGDWPFHEGEWPAAREGAVGRVDVRVERLVVDGEMLGLVLRARDQASSGLPGRDTDLEQAWPVVGDALETISEGLVLIDAAGQVAYVNYQAMELLQVRSDTVRGLPAEMLAELLAPRMVSGGWLPDVLNRAQVDGSTPVEEVTLVDGRVLELTGFSVPAPNGQVTGQGIVIRDVTEARALKRVRDELISIVSHELRTPMSSILGFAELLLTRDPPAEKRQMYAGVIFKEAERLSQLINDFLDLQRVMARAQQFDVAPVRLPALVQEVADTYALHRTTHPISIEVTPDLPTVMADPERVRQVISNLLSNAIKYSPDGGPVEIRLEPSPDAESVVVLVRDHGLGIPLEAQERLFEQFYRVDTSDRRDISGTGLGLSICQQIVTGHGGRIWAESEGLGCGSTFGFTLPFAAGREGLRRMPPQGDYILLIESDAGLASLVGEHLETSGYVVHWLNNPTDLVDGIVANWPQAVVLDVDWEDESKGWAALGELRAEPEGKRVPVVVVSSPDLRTQAVAAGADDCLLKPLDPEQLVIALERLIRQERHLVVAVDDDPLMLKLYERMLRREGYNLKGFVDAQEGLKYCRQVPPAAVVLDLMMPGLHGLAFLEDLRHDPVTADVPVVVITAMSLTQEQERFLQMPHTWVIGKGRVTLDQFRQVVAGALAGRGQPGGVTS
jgi:signal transduction histidine kinase/DNA-binding response OmpR family regulator